MRFHDGCLKGKRPDDSLVFYLSPMEIPLSTFEQHIDPVILKRGLYYFLENKVEPPELVAPGKWHAIVNGTEDYEVTLLKDKEVITDFVCTCPYDLGPVCKHVAAVIYFLQQDALDLVPEPGARQSFKRGRPKRSTTTGKDKPELNVQPDVRQSRRGRPRPGSFPAQHEIKQPVRNISKEIGISGRASYIKQIRAILKSAAGRGRFIDWNHVGQVGVAILAILQKAEKEFQSGRYRNAFMISSAVLEEMTKALDFADDSDGDIGDTIETSLSILHRLVTMELDESLRIELFNYAIAKYTGGEFDGWDWHTGMVELALSVCKEKEEAEKLNSVLETKPHSTFEEEQIQLIRLNLIEKIEGKQQADQFLADHLHYRQFRIMAMERAFAAGDYESVKKLAQEGIKQHQKAAPGWVSDWYEWLIRVAEAEYDVSRILEYATIQLFYHNTLKGKYYALLKAHTSPDDWPTTVEFLIRELTRSNARSMYGFLPEMLVREEMWARLLQLLEVDAQKWGVILPDLDLFAPHLARRFPDAFADLYEKGIRSELTYARSRKDYQRVCRHLRQFKKYGFIERVGAIVKSLIAEYPQRPALVEELRRV